MPMKDTAYSQTCRCELSRVLCDYDTKVSEWGNPYRPGYRSGRI